MSFLHDVDAAPSLRKHLRCLRLLICVRLGCASFFLFHLQSAGCGSFYTFCWSTGTAAASSVTLRTYHLINPSRFPGPLLDPTT